MINQENFQLIELEANQIIEIEIIQMIDHKTTPTVDDIIKIIMIDQVIILEVETTTIRTDQEIILCHHIEIVFNFEINKVKIIEAVHKLKPSRYGQYRNFRTTLTPHALRNPR